MKETPSDDPKAMICVRNCTGFDPIAGSSFQLDFRTKKMLNQHPMYKWTDQDGNEISSTSCDFKDFGGLQEKIDFTPGAIKFLNTQQWSSLTCYTVNPG